MTELKIGFMSVQELAKWSNRSKNYLEKHKTEWCEKQLGKYAKYELVRGGVEILEIYDPYFAGPLKKQVGEKFQKCWGYNEYFLVDTCKNAANKIQKVIKDKDANFTTIYGYTCNFKREFFGVPKIRDGKYGSCKFIMCKFEGDQAAPFTEKEEKVKNELLKKYFETSEERIVTMRGAREQYQKGEITEEEDNAIINEVMDRDYGWYAFLREFQKQCQIKVGIATYVELNAFTYPKDGKFEF